VKCKFGVHSPFLWAKNPKPSIFVQDIAYRPKKTQVYENLSKAENIVAYKQYSIYARAHPTVKPTMNKYEVS